MEILGQICKNIGFNPIRLDYNKPGKGKDQPDRESALGKGRIRNYINAGNDVTTAEEYKLGNFLQETLLWHLANTL